MKIGQVSIVGGTGRLVRRETAVLFDASGTNTELVAEFDRAPDDQGAFEAGRRLLIEADLEMGAFAMVRSEPQVELFVFGDLELHTNVASAPMVSGGSSSTWVEHRIEPARLAATDELRIRAGQDTAADTNFRLGVAGCGGFEVVLELADSAGPALTPVAPPPMPAAPARAPEPAAAPLDPVDAVPAAPASVDEPTDSGVAAPPPAPAAEPAPLPPPAPSYGSDPESAPPAAGFDSGPPGPPPAPPGAPAPMAPPPPGVPSPPVAQKPVDLPPPPAETVGESGAGNGSAGGLVEAAMCDRGHPNPTRASACLQCGRPVQPQPDWELVDQPVVGMVRFEDGSEVGIDRSVIIGRKPKESATSVTITIDHAEVSREHAEISVEGWAVWVTDLGSRNGTFVCPPGTDSPVRLDTGVQHYLESGTVVQLGTPQATFVYQAIGAAV